MNEYALVGHIYKKELKNKEWFKEGCIPEQPPEYIKDINLEDTEDFEVIGNVYEDKELLNE